MLTRLLRARGFTRGVLGGNRSWLAVWAVLAAARVARRIAGNKPRVLLCEPLAPGEVLVIRHGAPADADR
jgi:hypothetical protein